MKKVSHRTELAKNGAEKIEAKIQEIENLAYEGVFSDKNAVSRFQLIVSETKKLRQIARDAFLIVPINTVAFKGKGGVA